MSTAKAHFIANVFNCTQYDISIKLNLGLIFCKRFKNYWCCNLKLIGIL